MSSKRASIRQLPTELRVRIWTLTLPRSRVIGPIPSDSLIQRQNFTQSDPVALRVCKESRKVALDHFTNRNAERLEHWKSISAIKYDYYIDYSVDVAKFNDFLIDFQIPSNKDRTMILQGHMDSQFFSIEEMSQILHLHLVSSNLHFLDSNIHRWILIWMPSFNNVKDILVEVSINFDGDIYPHPDGGIRSVEAKLGETREVIERALQDMKHEKMAENVSWTMPNITVAVADSRQLARRATTEHVEVKDFAPVGRQAPSNTDWRRKSLLHTVKSLLRR